MVPGSRRPGRPTAFTLPARAASRSPALGALCFAGYGTTGLCSTRGTSERGIGNGEKGIGNGREETKGEQSNRGQVREGLGTGEKGTGNGREEMEGEQPNGIEDEAISIRSMRSSLLRVILSFFVDSDIVPVVEVQNRINFIISSILWPRECQY
jgi:hypothetical protein